LSRQSLSDSLLKDFTNPATIFWAGVWALFFHLIAGKKGAGATLLYRFSLSFIVVVTMALFSPSLLVSSLIRGKPPLGEFVMDTLFPLCVLPHSSMLRTALERSRWGRSKREVFRQAAELQRKLERNPPRMLLKRRVR